MTDIKSSKNSYETLEDLEVDEEIDAILNKLWVKLTMAFFMDTLGLTLTFIILDLSFRGPISYFYYWSPIDYFITWEYPLRVIPGTLLIFAGLCFSHLMAAIYCTIAYKDRIDKYIKRVIRTHVQRVKESKFKRK